jgi:ankyrin repeat protein
MTGPSYQLKNEEIQYLSILLEIIESGNWEALECTIINNPTVFRSFARKVSRSSELNGMTILHACARFKTPPPIIKLLLDLVPESPTCVDCLQRTPLHVAVGTHASLKTIKLLSSAFPEACAIQDDDGKTPLHLACDKGCELFEDDASLVPKPPKYEVVETLIKAYPKAVTLEDQDDMSALEHAIFSDAPIEVIKLLQYATRKQCELKRKKESKKAMGESRSGLDGPSFSVYDLCEPDTNAATVNPAREGEFSRRRVVRRNGDAMHV